MITQSGIIDKDETFVVDTASNTQISGFSQNIIAAIDNEWLNLFWQ